MTFQAYIDNIKAETGLSPADFKKKADAKGFTESGKLKPDIKVTQVVIWLKSEFRLGHGHAMAIVAAFKGKTK